MARAIFSGKLNVLNIVEMPISLYKAVDDGGVPFNRMTPCCNALTSQKIICKKCGGEQEYGKLLKGFFDGKELIEVKAEMLDKLKRPKSDTIRVDGFISETTLKRSVFETDKTYYVGVDEEKTKRRKNSK